MGAAAPGAPASLTGPQPMSPRVSTSAAQVAPFLAMTILERAQELERVGIDVAHLEVGEPSFDVPPCVAEAATRAIRDGATHYTHSLGLPELREEIAAYYARRCGASVEPDRVIVTTGSSGGLALLMALLLDGGDEVLLPDPGYACYPNFVRAFHGLPRFFPLEAAEGFRYDPIRVREQMMPRTRALLVNSPANPTGVIQPRSVLERLLDLGVPLISDEIYHGLEYGDAGEASAGTTSLLELTDRGFVLDGFSKRYAMTGWRIGWLVAPRNLVAPLQRLQQNLYICPGSVAQHAALAALREGEPDVARMLGEYRERRALLLAGLERIGLPVPASPQGAYYLLADTRHLGSDSLTLARALLEEAHVGVAPGADFGSRAEGYLRFSFASAGHRIQEGIARIEDWLQRGRPGLGADES
jgi:(5-formylfuran-3-yl)methyl phosphate transaminase